MILSYIEFNWKCISKEKKKELVSDYELKHSNCCVKHEMDVFDAIEWIAPSLAQLELKRQTPLLLL